MAKSDNTYRVGEIDLKHCKIANYTGDYTDITNLVAEFNIYSDIFSCGIKGDMVINDSVGLIELLPIVGDEVVVIEFKTPTTDRYNVYAMPVYKVTDRKKLEDRNETYVIHFCSNEIILDLQNNVEKTYKNDKVDNIVKKIFNRYLKTLKELKTEPAKNNFYYCGTNKSPISVIRYLQKHAQSNNNRSSNYMFFETTQDWQFVTMESLIQQEPVDSFYYSPVEFEIENQPGDSIIRKYQKILSVSNEQFDIINNYKNCMYAVDVKAIDPLRKEYFENEYRYDSFFDRIKHLHNNKLYTENSSHKGLKNGETKVVLSNIGNNYNQIDYLKKAGNDHRVQNPFKTHLFLDKKLSSIQQYNNCVVDITVYGYSDIDIGQIVNIYLPQNSDKEEFQTKNNLLYGDNNAKFLITGIRHEYNKENNSFITILQCIKDSYAIEPVLQ